MKTLVLGAALIAFSFGCKSNSNTSVSDPSGANMPKAECNKPCEGMPKADCQKACEGMKAKSACCSEKKPQG